MKAIRLFILLLVTAMCGTLGAQTQRELQQLMRDRGEYYFTLTVDNPSQIQAISELCSVDGTDGKTVVAYANQKEYDKLLAAGYTPNLQTPPSLLREAKMWDGNRATYEWDSYPTYSQYEAMMEAFGTDHPEICTNITLGTLSSGRKIMGVRINNGVTAGKPKFLYSSTIHGDEITGWIMMLRLIDELCTSTDSRIQNLIDNLDIFIFPNTNPDGTYYGGNNTVSGAKRYNANSVDMNRNYPDPHSSAHPDGNAYQSETQWFMTLAETYPFVMAANYHGGSQVMNYPWDNTSTRHADDDWWQYVSREYANLCQSVNSSYMIDENNGITNGADWYMIGGGRQDYMNGYMQCREITIECSTDKNPTASLLPNFWNYNHEAMLTFMEECLYGVHGFVYDATTGEPLDGVTVTVKNHDDEYSIVSSHEDGDYHRPIKGGSYTFKFTKDGYCSQEENVVITDGQRVDLPVYLTPAGDCPVAMSCYETVTPTAEGNYVMGYLNGSTLVMPSNNNASTVTTTSVTVTPTDNGFSVEEESTPGTITLTAYGSNGQYYISYNGRYLARSNYGGSLTWGTTQSSYGRWYINSNGIYVTTSSGGGFGGSSSSSYYLYYNNGSFALSTSAQNNITFYQEGDCPTVEYAITATAEPAEGGSVEGGGTYEEGETCTLTATPAEGYAFINWTEGGEEVSTDAAYSFQVTGDRTLVANFEEVPATVEYTITLSQGWNWFSSPVVADDLLAQLEEQLGTNGVKITAQDNNYCSYSTNLGRWVGNLQSLQVEQMYQVQTNTDCTVTITGTPANPSEHPITVNYGVNWIGFPSTQSLTVAQALADFTPANGDKIKPQSGTYATYYASLGRWIGNLTLEPGKGYIYQSMASDPGSLIIATGAKGGTSSNETGNTFWSPEHTLFPDNMCVAASLALNGLEESDDIEVAAFVNGQCRGAAMTFLVEETQQRLALFTVSGLNGETVSFKILVNGQELQADETLTFAINAVVGSVDQPFMLHIGTHSAVQVFPNPVNKGDSFNVVLPDGFDRNSASVVVYNALGTRVGAQRLNGSELQAINAPGVYTIKVSDEKGNAAYTKIIVK